jgi:transposase InsO family protein
VLLELSVVEQRYDAVMEVLRDGLSKTEVADRYGVSRQSVHAWIARYEEGGMAGLADRSHRPTSCPHQTEPAIEVQICELRRIHPDWGPRTIVHHLERRGVNPSPSRATVYRVLIRNHLIEPRRRRKRKTDYRRFERSKPMELWQADIMGSVFLASGQELKLITGVDDHSRFCVIARLTERATARPVCAAFTDALDCYGIPDEVLTDNGKVFTARFARRGGETLFDKICRAHGIHHILTGVRAPTTIGKVERFHETLRRDFFSKHTFSTIEQAQAALDTFVDEYNNRRPHQSLGMLSPIARFRFGSNTDIVEPDVAPQPMTRRPIEVERFVFDNGLISVANQKFSVGRRLAGQHVTVRIDGKLMHVFHNGELIKTEPRRSDKEVTRLRANRPYRKSSKSV